MDRDAQTTIAGFAAAGGIALIVAVVAALREGRHRRRADLDQVSLVSWSLLSALCSMLAIILLATATRLIFAPTG
jgi:Na+-translocating ferredoxin:NAD+ oxidoreductase RnfA subunit